jgi:cytochrome P450
MTLYPGVKKMAQKQLDEFLQAGYGSESGHLPTLNEDANRLPYLTAVVYETLRWRAIIPLGRVSRVIHR